MTPFRLNDDHLKRLDELKEKLSLENRTEVIRFMIDKFYAGVSNFRNDFPVLYFSNNMVGKIRELENLKQGSEEFDFVFGEILDLANEINKAIKLYNAKTASTTEAD